MTDNDPRALCENVSVSFAGRPVLTELSLTLARGGRYALIGPNGAGKTTLMRLLCGSLRPHSGQVTVGGLDPWRERERVLASVAVLAENAPLLPELTPHEHLKLAADLRGLSAGEFSARRDELCAKLNLADFLKRPAGALSIGQKRRAALAAAVVGSPDFFILDEPSAGLDPEETRRLYAFLEALAPTSTLLISTHILSEAARLTHEAIVLAGGRVAANGAWADLSGREKPDEADLHALYLKWTEGEGA